GSAQSINLLPSLSRPSVQISPSVFCATAVPADHPTTKLKANNTLMMPRHCHLFMTLSPVADSSIVRMVAPVHRDPRGQPPLPSDLQQYADPRGTSPPLQRLV